MNPGIYLPAFSPKGLVFVSEPEFRAVVASHEAENTEARAKTRPEGAHAQAGRPLAARYSETLDEKPVHHVPAGAELLGERMAADAMVVGETAWVDDTLSLRDRSLIVLSALAAQGGVESRMRGHVRLALAHGVTPEEMEAAMALLGAYAGYPRASIAIEVVADELERLGRPIPKTNPDAAAS